MKGNKLVWIGVALLLIFCLAWVVLSINEFYEKGQELALWNYFKNTSPEKLKGTLAFLIPALAMLIYEFYIKKQQSTE
jgi:hypothetical protein